MRRFLASIVLLCGSLFAQELPDLTIRVKSYNAIMSEVQGILTQVNPQMNQMLPLIVAQSLGLKQPTPVIPGADADKPIVAHFKLPAVGERLKGPPQSMLMIPVTNFTEFKNALGPNSPLQAMGSVEVDKKAAFSMALNPELVQQWAKSPVWSDDNLVSIRVQGPYLNTQLDNLIGIVNMTAMGSQDPNQLAAIKMVLELLGKARNNIQFFEVGLKATPADLFLGIRVVPKSGTEFSKFFTEKKQPIQGLKGLMKGDQSIEFLGRIDLTPTLINFFGEMVGVVYSNMLKPEDAKKFKDIYMNFVKELNSTSMYGSIDLAGGQMKGSAIYYKEGYDSSKIVKLTEEMVSIVKEFKMGDQPLFSTMKFEKNVRKIGSIPVHRYEQTSNTEMMGDMPPAAAGLMNVSYDIVFLKDYLVYSVNGGGDLEALIKKVQSGKLKGTQSISQGDVEVTLNVSKMIDSFKSFMSPAGDMAGNFIMDNLAKADLKVKGSVGMTKEFSAGYSVSKEMIHKVAGLVMMMQMGGGAGGTPTK